MAVTSMHIACQTPVESKEDKYMTQIFCDRADNIFVSDNRFFFNNVLVSI